MADSPAAVGLSSTRPAPAGLARLDELPARAAEAAPGRVALRGGGWALTYAELGAAVTRWAALLRGAVGEGQVIAVASVLDPGFAIGYYAAARAGCVAAVVNPLLRPQQLAHVLGLCSARLLIGPRTVLDRVATVRHDLPALRGTIEIGGKGDLREASVDHAVAGQSADAPAGLEDPPVGRLSGPESTAAIQFTSGTTGQSKGVMLTHRNLTVNAAQIAAVHRLTGDSVTLNQLPTFHPMHLNSAVWAGASQVLCPTMDPVVGIEAAAAAGAHRYFALPVHLAKLAADERLAGLRLPTVQAIMSGGSALPVPAADRLSSHFGIPVIQGYGLAETSPLTHCDLIDRPEPASVGYPVDGTECRVVDLATGAVLGAGERGEVQVRGPQLMKGYLGGVPSGIDADGWFRTGDVGVCDADGRLYLVDRIKDVFKCDNWLVSPAEIEQVVRRHPLVSDCAVVDRPEKFSGAVAYGFVVPAQPLADAGLAELTAELNRDLPYYQRLCRIEAVAALPRSPNGKIERRLLRDRAGAASW